LFVDPARFGAARFSPGLPETFRVFFSAMHPPRFILRLQGKFRT
jgi:hypothetical protein